MDFSRYEREETYAERKPPPPRKKPPFLLIAVILVALVVLVCVIVEKLHSVKLRNLQNKADICNGLEGIYTEAHLTLNQFGDKLPIHYIEKHTICLPGYELDSRKVKGDWCPTDGHVMHLHWIGDDIPPLGLVKISRYFCNINESLGFSQGTTYITEISPGNRICLEGESAILLRSAYQSDPGTEDPRTLQWIYFCARKKRAADENIETVVKLFDEQSSTKCPWGGFRLVIGEDDCKGGLIEGTVATVHICDRVRSSDISVGNGEFFMLSEVRDSSCPGDGWHIIEGKATPEGLLDRSKQFTERVECWNVSNQRAVNFKCRSYETD
jgi:hypothetical protein